MKTRFEKTLEYVRTAHGGLEILARARIDDLESLLRQLTTKYQAPLVAEPYSEATTEDVARAVSKNIENLFESRHYVRGLGLQDSISMNKALAQFIPFTRSARLQQSCGKWQERIESAIETLLASELASPNWAGSAR